MAKSARSPRAPSSSLGDSIKKTATASKSATSSAAAVTQSTAAKTPPLSTMTSHLAPILPAQMQLDSILSRKWADLTPKELSAYQMRKLRISELRSEIQRRSDA
jgi:hypothetical protein